MANTPRTIREERQGRCRPASAPRDTRILVWVSRFVADSRVQVEGVVAAAAGGCNRREDLNVASDYSSRVECPLKRVEQDSEMAMTRPPAVVSKSADVKVMMEQVERLAGGNAVNQRLRLAFEPGVVAATTAKLPRSCQSHFRKSV